LANGLTVSGGNQIVRIAVNHEGERDVICNISGLPRDAREALSEALKNIMLDLHLKTVP
jgi:translation initiation factor 1 (eIF-1/SUI1)